jgi:preprotein translocase subunit SecA
LPARSSGETSRPKARGTPPAYIVDEKPNSHADGKRHGQGRANAHLPSQWRTFTTWKTRIKHHVNQRSRAHACSTSSTGQDGEIVIVDEFTGRSARTPVGDGLHQAGETGKVKIERENQTLTVTFKLLPQ